MILLKVAIDQVLVSLGGVRQVDLLIFDSLPVLLDSGVAVSYYVAQKPDSSIIGFFPSVILRVTGDKPVQGCRFLKLCDLSDNSCESGRDILDEAEDAFAENFAILRGLEPKLFTSFPIAPL